jgi:hypothetical protein
MANPIIARHKRYRVMLNKRNSKSNSEGSMIYQVRIKGHLDHQWADWFENATITPEEDGNTLLTLPVIDQAVLHGLLKKIRDLGMPLLSVNRIVSDQINNSTKEK